MESSSYEDLIYCFLFAYRAAKLFIAIFEKTVSVLKSSEFCFTLEVKDCYSSFL